MALKYSTDVSLLPPIERIAPEIVDAVILPDDPSVYEKVEVRYQYRDQNNDPEDISGREIRWYINGERKAFLDNLEEWNDISNEEDPIYLHGLTFSLADLDEGESVISRARRNGDSILKPNDNVFYTVKTFDGELFSEQIKSNTVTVTEDQPSLDDLRIMGRSTSGVVSDIITSSDTAFVDLRTSWRWRLRLV